MAIYFQCIVANELLLATIQRSHRCYVSEKMTALPANKRSTDANAQWGLKLLSRHHVAESGEENMQVERPATMLQII